MNSGDNVACMVEGTVRYGELQLTVGMDLPDAAGSTLTSIISSFDTVVVSDKNVLCTRMLLQLRREIFSPR